MERSRDELRKIAANIPVIILAGGLGTRISEETVLLPKPMLEIGGLPIIVHIMDFYSKYGFCNFVICGGYKIEVIKNYFVSLPLVGKDVEINFSERSHEVVSTKSKYAPSGRQQWKVSILETGAHSMTGARVAMAMNYLNQKQFQHVCLTYGDGLTDVDLHKELDFHLSHRKVATVLGVHQPTRFGIFQFDSENCVTRFEEKPKEYINGGYFIFNKGFEWCIPPGTRTVFETEALGNLVAARELCVFRHSGFWQCMDTKREKTMLEQIYESNDAPWTRAVNEN